MTMRGDDTSFIGLFSSCFASCFTKTLNAPFDRVKLILQTQAIIPQLDQKPRGIVNCFRRIYMEEGLQAFWRGNLPMVLRVFPHTFISMPIRDLMRSINPNDKVKKSFLFPLIVGGLTGVMASFLTYPLEFLHVRLAADVGRTMEERQFRGMIDCFNQINKSDGVRGFYRGFLLQFYGIFIYRAFYFGLYDIGRQFLPKDNGFLTKFLFAQLVTTATGGIAYPLEVMKVRLMLQSGKSVPIYTGLIDCARQILRKEGIRGYFGGYLFTLIRGVGGSISLVGYDWIKG